MNYARQFAHHAALTVVTTLLTGALFYLLRIVLYKYLSQDEYGLFYVLFSYVTIIQTVITFGFDPGLVPFITRYREENDPGAMKSLALGALVPQGILTGIVVVAFLTVPPIVAPWVGYPGAPALFRIFADPVSPGLFRVLALHAVFVLLFKCGQQVLLGVQAIAWRNASDLARAVLCLGGAIVLLHMGWGVYATAAAYTLGALAEVVVISAALLISFPHVVRARFTWRPKQVREAFDSGKWLSVGFGGIVVFSSVDTIVISLVRESLSDAAAYQIALPTITILYSLMIAAGISLLPTVRTLWLRGERALLADGLQRLYGAAIAIMIPAGVLLACGSDVLMTTLFGKNVLNAGDAFDVLAVGGIAFFLAYINLHVLAGIDRPRVAGIAVICGLALDFALSLPLTHWFGIRGTAIAGVCGYSLAAGMGLIGIRRLMPVRVPVGAVLGSVSVSIVAGVVATVFRQRGVISVERPIFSAILGAAILLAVLAASELIGFSELRKLLAGVGWPLIAPLPKSKP
jgi:O-antigen/teichoic acid export membrane protein